MTCSCLVFHVVSSLLTGLFCAHLLPHISDFPSLCTAVQFPTLIVSPANNYLVCIYSLCFPLSCFKLPSHVCQVFLSQSLKNWVFFPPVDMNVSFLILLSRISSILSFFCSFIEYFFWTLHGHWTFFVIQSSITSITTSPAIVTIAHLVILPSASR